MITSLFLVYVFGLCSLKKRCMLHNEASNHFKAKMGISVNAEPEVPEFGPFGGKH